MPHHLHRYHVEPNPMVHGAIDLTLTNSVHHPGDPTSYISNTLTVDEGSIVSEPQIEVSLTHASA